MIDRVVALVAAGEGDAAVELVRGDGEPGEAAARFSDVVRALYWEEKDLAAAVVVARGGIRYCLDMMDAAASAEAGREFGRRAQVIANNLASFTWPGWDEPGIAPGTEEMAAGLEAARLNMRLASELAYEPGRVANARWLLGAQLLAAGDAQGALMEFERCDPGARPLFAGYVALAKVMLGRAEGQREFDRALEVIAAADGEDAAFARSQLETAHRVFVKG